jgi:hypothetical protein
LQPIEEIKYKLVNVQSAKAVIVNAQNSNAPIESGFAASMEGPLMKKIPQNLGNLEQKETKLTKALRNLGFLRYLL